MRHGMPEELELSYSSIAPIFEDTQPVPLTVAQASARPSAVHQQPLTHITPETLAILTEWMSKAGISPEEVQTLVSQKGHFPVETPISEYPEKFVRGWLMNNWSQVVDTIHANPEHVPC